MKKKGREKNMLIELKILNENEDGTTNAELCMDNESKNILINYGVVAALKAAIDEVKNYGNNIKEEKQEEQEWEQLYLDLESPPERNISIKANDEIIDEIVLSSLKDTYVTTYMKMWHAEDTLYNIKFRKHMQAVLRHYMVSADAEEFIESVDKQYEENDE